MYIAIISMLILLKLNLLQILIVSDTVKAELIINFKNQYI